MYKTTKHITTIEVCWQLDTKDRTETIRPFVFVIVPKREGITHDAFSFIIITSYHYISIDLRGYIMQGKWQLLKTKEARRIRDA